MSRRHAGQRHQRLWSVQLVTVSCDRPANDVDQHRPDRARELAWSVRNDLGLNRSTHHLTTVAACAIAPQPAGFTVSRLYGVGERRLAGGLLRLSPEDGIGVSVEAVEQILNAGTGVQELVAMELEVPVAPVQRP